MVAGRPRRLVLRLVEGDVHVVQAEIINLAARGTTGDTGAGAVVAEVVLSRHVHITTDGGIGQRRFQGRQLCFVCANRGRHADSANSRES